MSVRLLHGRKLNSWYYELTVEHSLFGFFPRVQIYRGHILWKRYPQGDEYWGIWCGWMEAQCQQFEWSKEVTS